MGHLSSKLIIRFLLLPLSFPSSPSHLPHSPSPHRPLPPPTLLPPHILPHPLPSLLLLLFHLHRLLITHLILLYLLFFFPCFFFFSSSPSFFAENNLENKWRYLHWTSRTSLQRIAIENFCFLSLLGRKIFLQRKFCSLCLTLNQRR